MPHEPYRLPATPADWESCVKDTGIQNASFSNIAGISSQENGLNFSQYLHLRALYTTGGPGDLHRTWKNFVSVEKLEQSALTLRTSRGWSKYLIALCNEARHNEIPEHMDEYSITRICLTNLGKRLKQNGLIDECDRKAFSSKVRGRGKRVPYMNGAVNPRSIADEDGRPKLPLNNLQRDNNLAYSTGFPVPPMYRSKDSFAPSSDEMIVASTLLEFLNAISRECDTQGRWVLMSKILPLGTHSKFDGGVDVRLNGLFSPAIPGCEASVESLAIFDASSQIRNMNDNRVQMQQAAQIAAWLFGQPRNASVHTKSNQEKMAILVSQHLNEIFLTFAQYDNAYIDYLHDKTTTSQASFLHLSEFGPFAISSAQDIEILVPVLTGWHFMTCDEEYSTGEKDMWNDSMNLCSQTEVKWLEELHVSDDGNDNSIRSCRHAGKGKGRKITEDSMQVIM